ncbi:23555_t:CDS:2, partial [Racocetra persica]
SEFNSEQVHEIEDNQEIEESSRNNSKDIEADESSISLQSANSIDHEDDILNEYIQPSQLNEEHNNNDDQLAFISCELTIKVKKLKQDNQFSVPSLINVFDQEMGKEKQEINLKANPWNRRFTKGEVVASHVYKIMEAEAFIIYHKGWKIIHDSETIDPPRLRKRIADNKNVPKCQLYNKSVSDNSEYDQDMDKLINVVSEMFNQSTNSIQATMLKMWSLTKSTKLFEKDDERNDE